MVEDSLPSLEWLRKRLADAEPDLLREMMRMVVTALMGAEVDELCGATYGERSPERVNRRRYHDAWLCRTWRPSWWTQWTSGRRRTPPPPCWWRSS